MDIVQSDEGSNLFDSVRFADVRAQDRIAARLRKVSPDGVFRDVRVWGLNPFGIEVLYPESLVSLEVGTQVQVDLVLFGQRSNFSGVITSKSQKDDQHCICRIRFLFSEDEESRRVDRKSARWLCSENFLPVAVAPSPSFFDDWMYFQVRDISAGGIQLTTSLRNKYLLPGTSLQLSLMFPVSGNAIVQFRIKRVGVVAIGSKDMLQLGGEIENLDPKSRNVIGQYLLQFAPQATLEELRQAGIVPESLFRGASIRYARTKEDYSRVLNLRLEANRVSGQLGAAKTPEDMIDSDDSKSRILLATRGEETVATVRIRYPTVDDRLEAEKYLVWPDSLPRREELFEVSRLAVNVAYRGKDVLPSMFHYIALSSIGVDRPWITVSAMKKYVPFYLKVGFKDTNLTYKDPRWSNELHVLISHSLEAIKGKGASPIYWYVMWSKVLENLERDGVISLTRMDRVRTSIYRFIGSVTKLVR